MRGAKTTFSAEALEYLAEHARQDDVLARVERETAELPRSGMQITPDQGALLTVLAQLTQASDALELGTFTGYSAICIARGLQAGGRLTCLEIDPDFAATAQRNLVDARLDDRATIVLGPAEDTLAGLPETPTYDFVFLDADKQAYADYSELVRPRTKPGGLILIDNTLLGGRVLDPSDDSSRSVAALNDRIAQDERVDSAMALIADGVTFVRKR
jgi:caffeoyl-CoA O-methyltransferase